MSSKEYKQTEEHRRKIGEAQIGIKNHNYGKHSSQETNLKRSISLKKAYEEGRKKVSPNFFNSSIGIKHSKERIEKNRELRNKYYETHSSWNKGLTPRKEKYKTPSIKINLKQILLSHYVWCKVNQIHRVPTEYVIHHLDFNPKNNAPENLQLLEKKYHHQAHAIIQKSMLL